MNYQCQRTEGLLKPMPCSNSHPIVLPCSTIHFEAQHNILYSREQRFYQLFSLCLFCPGCDVIERRAQDMDTARQVSPKINAGTQFHIDTGTLPLPLTEGHYSFHKYRGIYYTRAEAFFTPTDY